MTSNIQPSEQPTRSARVEEEELPKCRICYEETNEKKNPLIRPCKCSGSMRFTHRLCLQKWRMHSTNSVNTYKCSVCKQEYRITTRSSLRKGLYLFALPGLEALFYSCCISYVIGYFFTPGENASRAQKAMLCPPFTPVRRDPTEKLISESYSEKIPYRSWDFGRIRETILQRQTSPSRTTADSDCGSGLISTWKSSLFGVLGTSKFYRRIFTGQYTWSVTRCIPKDVGAALGLDRWQIVLDLVLIWRFPELISFLFDYVIFDHAPILERPIQMLLTGKIFYDFTKITKSIYDTLLVEYYIPNHLPSISDVKDLNNLSEDSEKRGYM